MTLEHLPNLDPPPFGEVENASLPVLSFAWESDGPHRVAEHSHIRAHIIRPDAGALWVVTAEGRWLVPSGQAVWIAPMVHHQVYTRGSVSARMIFVDPAYAEGLPIRSGTVAVNPLLTELLHRAVSYGNDYPADGPMTRLAAVILDEIAALEPSHLLLPIGRDERLTGVMERLIADPATAAGLPKLAGDVGASPRTLARLFRNETGMSFMQWRARLRLVEAVERLARGATVSEVAFDLGYSTISSFGYMFRRYVGMPPGIYRSQRTGPERQER